MCGINLILDLSNRKDLKSLVSSMNKCISYRGPDPQGILLKDNASLGHRRLSILDISERGTER